LILRSSFLWGAKTAIDEGLQNVAFIRTQIELINHIFAEDEVDEIWITFQILKLNTNVPSIEWQILSFLQLYKKKYLKKTVILTDSEFMHGYTLGFIPWHTRSRKP
jgi:tRNA (guanine-N7-)-methyltransferase